MIQPKFEVGQPVFVGRSEWSVTRLTCPDCLGTKVWGVTTPSGEQFEVPCHTCEEGYFCSGTVKKWDDVPRVDRLTVSSIRIDTSDERPVSYMMRETSSGGSGTIHYEEGIFLTHDEAMAYAIERTTAAKEQKRQNEIKDLKKKNSRRKPEWWERKIKDLERKIAELQAAEAPA